MAAGTRTRLLSMAVLALVFVSGATVGIALDRQRSDEPAVASEDSGDEESSERDGERRGRMLYERVEDIRPEQHARIDSVLEHHQSSLRAMNHELRAEFDDLWDLQREYRKARDDRFWTIVDSTRAAIRSIFDPDQAAQYDSLTADYDRRRSEEERSGDSGR